FSSLSPAFSTPVTASASNAFPSSINSATLSESAPPMLDNPCKSPDCPLLALSPSSASASVTEIESHVGTAERSVGSRHAAVRRGHALARTRRGHNHQARLAPIFGGGRPL